MLLVIYAKIKFCLKISVLSDIHMFYVKFAVSHLLANEKETSPENLT